MKEINGQEYITIGEVSERIGRSVRTIKNWYQWAEQTGNLDNLPKVKRVGEKGTRHFRTKDVDKLVDFRDNIKYGTMSEFNRDKWGKRGAHIKGRMEQKEEAQNE